VFVKKPELRPEDMGHKNPPLHDLNMESRRIDAAIRDSEELAARRRSTHSPARARRHAEEPPRRDTAAGR
jgi:hypothetical protein